MRKQERRPINSLTFLITQHSVPSHATQAKIQTARVMRSDIAIPYLDTRLSGCPRLLITCHVVRLDRHLALEVLIPRLRLSGEAERTNQHARSRTRPSRASTSICKHSQAFTRSHKLSQAPDMAAPAITRHQPVPRSSRKHGVMQEHRPLPDLCPAGIESLSESRFDPRSPQLRPRPARPRWKPTVTCQGKLIPSRPLLRLPRMLVAFGLASAS